MEPRPTASPMVGMWGRGVLSSQRSTALNAAWSSFSSSTLPSDTVGTQAPQVTGPCTAIPAAPAPATALAVPSDSGTWGSLLHPTRSQGTQAPGNTCSNPSVHHEPGVLAPAHALPVCRCPRSRSAPHCSLPLGHSGVWAHR